MGDPRDYFFTLARRMADLRTTGEVFTCEFRAEDSNFVRFNRGGIGQVGNVQQAQLEVDLMAGRRHAIGSTTLCGNMAADGARLRQLFDTLRDTAAASDEDPFLMFSVDPSLSSEQTTVGRLPEAGEVVDCLHRHGADADLVGIYAGGVMQRGFASSFGQENWHSAESFHLDWSLFDRLGRAAKASYAGVEWSGDALALRMASTRENLDRLDQPPRELRPGKYRVYLAPAALAELTSLLAWGGFGLRARMTKVSPFLRLHEGSASLAPAIHLSENIAGGAAPAFERSGFTRPDRVRLIEGGRAVDSLVSPRSAMEFGIATNGADSDEAPVSLDMAAGDLDADDIAAAVHTGVLVSNLWYLNYSDRPACRATGMTRFATLWVENG